MNLENMLETLYEAFRLFQDALSVSLFLLVQKNILLYVMTVEELDLPLRFRWGRQKRVAVL